MTTFDIGMNFEATCNLNRMLLSVKYSHSKQLEKKIYHNDKQPRNCNKAKIRFFHGDCILIAHKCHKFSWLNMHQGGQVIYKLHVKKPV